MYIISCAIHTSFSANVHLSRPCLRYIIIGTTGINDEGGSGCSDYNIMYLGIIIVYNYCGTASRTHRKIVDPFLLCVYVDVYRRLILLHNQRGYSQDLGSYGNQLIYYSNIMHADGFGAATYPQDDQSEYYYNIVQGKLYFT